MCVCVCVSETGNVCILEVGCRRCAWNCVFNFFSISSRNIIVLRFILQFCVVFQTLTGVGMTCHILKNTSPYRNQF